MKTSDPIKIVVRVVPLERVFPHEHVDPHRVDRLMGRLEEDGIFKNPPIVMQAGDDYVVLDGATRVTAFRQLGYEHIIVQVITSQDQLSLYTWHHIVCDMDVDAFLSLVKGLPEVASKDCDLNNIEEKLLGKVCYLHTADDRICLIEAAPGYTRLDALNKMTSTYIQAGMVARTMDRDIEQVKPQYPNLTALVVFPTVTVDRVLEIAKTGQVVPAGITRFVIPGRVLRLNADLDYLKSDDSLAEKNQWLSDLMQTKFDEGRVRYYQEPVYLLDE